MSFSSENQSPSNLAGLSPVDCYRLLAEHRRVWQVPTVVCAILALGYALVMSRYWEASQGLMVRPEVSNSESSEPGKFSDIYAMRTFQETILELAKSTQVISATLQAVEQAVTGESATLPTGTEIEELRDRLSLSPPGGAEFGKTEVCYLQVKDTDRQRAIKLVAEFARQIDQRLRRLKTEQSQSLSNELQQQVAQAQAALEKETARLAEFETNVGADLGELRMLNASFSGQSDLRQQSVNLNDERRSAELEVRRSEQLLAILEAARLQPEQLIAMPNSLLESQPTLRRLKDGLVDAQLRAARLGGTRTAAHPQVRAAAESVEYIRDDLHDELEVAIRGVQVELQLGKARTANLQQQAQGVQDRLGRLAELRAGYENRTSAVENSRLVLDQAQKRLGEVSATLVAAHSARLVTPIDRPDTGSHPVGPGRASIVLLGTFGGFALGMGWLFLTVVPRSQPTAPQYVTTPEESNGSNGSDHLSPIQRNIPSSLSPSVAAKIAEIVASRGTTVPRDSSN